MVGYVKSNGVWSKFSPYGKNVGTWAKAKYGYVKNNSAWQLFWQGLGTQDSKFNLTSANVSNGASDYVYKVLPLSDGKILLGGAFSHFNGKYVGGLVRLNSDGSLDTTWNVNTNYTQRITDLVQQSDGKIVAVGAFTKYSNVTCQGIVRLNSDGTVDNVFGTGFNSTATIYKVALQADGKILAAGYFSSFRGTSKSGIVRINTDGTIDTTFVGTGISGSSFQASGIAVQSDQKIVLVGPFTSYNGTAVGGIVRINTDGSLDNTFTTGTGLDYAGDAVTVIQSDGKIVLGGQISLYNGTATTNIFRINSNGSFDVNFSSPSYPYDLTIQTDQKIVACGSEVNRFNTNGTRDTSFVAPTNYSYYPYVSGYLQSVAIQSDGKVLTGGSVTSWSSGAIGGYARLTSTGSVDSTFVNYAGNYGFDGPPWHLSVQSNDQIIVTGRWTKFNGTSATTPVRISSLGVMDTTFNSNVGTGTQYCRTTLQPSDQKILVWGNFTSFNTNVVYSILRLNTNGTRDFTFASPFATVTNIENCVIDPIFGKSYVAGSIGSTYFIYRLNTDGSIDSTFNSGGSGPSVRVTALIAQPDGKILVGLGNTPATYNGTSVKAVFRLNSDGTIDSSFALGNTPFNVNQIGLLSNGDVIWTSSSSPYVSRVSSTGVVNATFNTNRGTGSGIYALFITSKDVIFLGGGFSMWNGSPKQNVVVLNADGTFNNDYANNSGYGFSNQFAAGVQLSDERLVFGGNFFAYDQSVKNRIVVLGGSV